jgi:hypothetical protein
LSGFFLLLHRAKKHYETAAYKLSTRGLKLDQRISTSIRKQDIDEVTEIVERLTTRKRRERPKSNWMLRVESAEKWVRRLGIIGLVECAILAFASYVFDSSPLAQAVLAMSLLITLLGIAVLISPIALSIPFLRTVYRTPFAPLTEALNDAIELDLPMVLELVGREREAVEYVLAHYRHQRLDKIGFFPAVFAFATLMIPAWEHLDAWIRSIALVVPAFHFMNMLSYGLTQEMDRTIALLEYSLAARERVDIVK